MVLYHTSYQFFSILNGFYCVYFFFRLFIFFFDLNIFYFIYIINCLIFFIILKLINYIIINISFSSIIIETSDLKVDRYLLIVRYLLIAIQISHLSTIDIGWIGISNNHNVIAILVISRFILIVHIAYFLKNAIEHL
jgi:hypothetical protein